MGHANPEHPGTLPLHDRVCPCIATVPVAATPAPLVSLPAAPNVPSTRGLTVLRSLQHRSVQLAPIGTAPLLQAVQVFAKMVVARIWRSGFGSGLDKLC